MRINICNGYFGARSNICDSVQIVCKSLCIEKVCCVRAAIVVKTLLVVRKALLLQSYRVCTYSYLRKYSVICDPIELKFKSIGVNPITHWIRNWATVECRKHLYRFLWKIV